MRAHWSTLCRLRPSMLRRGKKDIYIMSSSITSRESSQWSDYGNLTIEDSHAQIVFRLQLRDKPHDHDSWDLPRFPNRRLGGDRQRLYLQHHLLLCRLKPKKFPIYDHLWVVILNKTGIRLGVLSSFWVIDPFVPSKTAKGNQTSSKSPWAWGYSRVPAI